MELKNKQRAKINDRDREILEYKQKLEQFEQKFDKFDFQKRDLLLKIDVKDQEI